MKVLITGGTGTISSGIVKKCNASRMEVYAITRGKHNYRNINPMRYLKQAFFQQMEEA